MRKLLLILLTALSLLQAACLLKVEDLPAIIDHLELRRDLLPVDASYILRTDAPVAEKLAGAYIRFALEQGINVYLDENLLKNHRWVGAYDSDNNALYLDPTVGSIARAQAAIHEMAHWCSPKEVLLTKTEAEVVAESVTFMVTSQVKGWQWGNYSLAYIIYAVPAYQRNTMLLRNAGIIQRCAEVLAEVIPLDLRK